MKGYIAVLDKAVANTNEETIYLKEYEEDWNWDSLHLRHTDCINKALFLDEDEKEILENVLIHHGEEEYVYFIEVERNTDILI